MHLSRPATRHVSLCALLFAAPVFAQQLPDGNGKATVERACSVCHPAAMVIGRHLNREEWGAEVTKMVQQGAKLTDAEFTQTVDYLARNFGPTQNGAPATAATPPPPPAPAGGRGGRTGRGGFAQQAPSGPAPGRGGAAGGSGPAEMQVIDAAAADRGRAVYIAECVTCHGPRARGASDGVPEPQKGSDLVRSVVVLHDRYGNEIGPFVAKGHPMQSGKPGNSLTEAQIVDLSHFLHQKVADTLRSGPYSQIQNVLTGNAKNGEAYFNGAGGCKACHSPTGDLAGIGKRFDAATIQQRFLFPRSGGRRGGGGGGSNAQTITVTVTPPNGPAVKGPLLSMDDFNVTLRTAEGDYRTVARLPGTKVEKQDPLQAHIDLLEKITDRNMHDVVAYLESLK